MDELQDCMNQVYRMALAAMQSYAFWLYTRPDDSPYEEALKKYGHFFYATHEAHFTTVFISLDCVYDDKPKLLNFTKLLNLLPSKLSAAECESFRKEVAILAKKAEGIGIIRNNSFAHLSSHEIRQKIAEKYGLNNGDLMTLCYQTLKLATKISKALGIEVSSVDEIAQKDIETVQFLFDKLQSGNA
jgi:hypothetical protein